MAKNAVRWKIFCGIFLDSMQSRMKRIERGNGLNTAEAGLSQAKCKQTLKMITNRLNNKLRVLARNTVAYFQKDATAKASCDV